MTPEEIGEIEVGFGGWKLRELIFDWFCARVPTKDYNLTVVTDGALERIARAVSQKEPE
jgi:hypothetical protein